MNAAPKPRPQTEFFNGIIAVVRDRQLPWRLKIIVAILKQLVIERILTRLGLQTLPRAAGRGSRK